MHASQGLLTSRHWKPKLAKRHGVSLLCTPSRKPPCPPEAPFPAPLSLHSLPSYYSLTSAPAWSCAAETNHIIVDMRFNQVIRAEPRAGEYGPGVPEYQAGLGSRPQQIEKSFTAQLGARQPSRGRPLPSFRSLCARCSAVTGSPGVRGLRRNWPTLARLTEPWGLLPGDETPHSCPSLNFYSSWTLNQHHQTQPQAPALCPARV